MSFKINPTFPSFPFIKPGTTFFLEVVDKISMFSLLISERKRFFSKEFSQKLESDFNLFNPKIFNFTESVIFPKNSSSKNYCSAFTLGSLFNFNFPNVKVH